MPSFNIIRQVEPDNSFRVATIKGNFDLDITHIKEEFTGNIEIEGKAWNVGLIVGGSGTGKSTIAKELFPENYCKGYEYTAKSIIDDMPKGASVKDIEKTFTSVGFSSPPSWLKPYSVLSNGEKMRADLARAILECKDLIVFDEFTSVVNREVAKTGAYAISKAVRRMNIQFIAVSCHRDITEWLEPDWIYDSDLKHFRFAGGNSASQKLNLKSMSSQMKINIESGNYLGSIII